MLLASQAVTHAGSLLWLSGDRERVMIKVITLLHLCHPWKYTVYFENIPFWQKKSVLYLVFTERPLQRQKWLWFQSFCRRQKVAEKGLFDSQFSSLCETGNEIPLTEPSQHRKHVNDLSWRCKLDGAQWHEGEMKLTCSGTGVTGLL